jgi:hypothetical protein
MTITRPQAANKVASKTVEAPAREVKSPGASTKEVVEPGVTFSFNVVMDKAGSTAIVQFHLPLSMAEQDMQRYTRKALGVVELEQLRFDRNKLKVEIKLSSALLDSLKEEFTSARSQRDEEAKRSGNGKVAKPVNQQLIAMDNNLRQAMRRHDSMIADFAQMEQRLGPDSSTDS